MKVYMVTIKEKNLGVESIKGISLHSNEERAKEVVRDYMNFGYIAYMEEKEIDKWID